MAIRAKNLTEDAMEAEAPASEVEVTKTKKYMDDINIDTSKCAFCGKKLVTYVRALEKHFFCNDDCCKKYFN